MYSLDCGKDMLVLRVTSHGMIQQRTWGMIQHPRRSKQSIKWETLHLLDVQNAGSLSEELFY